jgi:hypothetical protein
MINVIENIIPKELQDEIEKYLLSHEFPVYLGKTTVAEDDPTVYRDKNTKDYPMFNHAFVARGECKSQWFGLISPIVNNFISKLNLESAPNLYRCKLNISFPNREFADGDYLTPHYDIEDAAIIAIYYVNDSDGDTLFFEDPKNIPKHTDHSLTITESLTPKKGTMVYFNNKTLHANRPPQHTRIRCVINFVFLL